MLPIEKPVLSQTPTTSPTKLPSLRPTFNSTYKPTTTDTVGEFNNNAEDDDLREAGSVAGGVVGGFVFLAVLGVGVALFRRRLKEKKQADNNSSLLGGVEVIDRADGTFSHSFLNVGEREHTNQTAQLHDPVWSPPH